MRTSGLLGLVTGMTGTAAALASLLAVVAWMDNRTMRQELTGLRSQRQGALDEARDAQRLLRETEDKLAHQEEDTGRLRSEVEALRRIDRSYLTNNVERKAVRAQVFLGQQALGEAWVLQGGATNQSGVPPAPVVVLNATVLPTVQAIAARRQQAAEPARDVTVNYNYPSYTPWNTWWPYAVFPSGEGTNSPPTGGGGVHPSPPSRPPAGGTVGGSGIWRPTEKPFLPGPSPWPIVTPSRSFPSGSGTVQRAPSIVPNRVIRPAVSPVVRGSDFRAAR